MANYSFVVDNHFQPFSFQEMLTPFTMYKDAFEKAEQSYIDLTKEADTFKYLSETLPENSKARQIYENYANGLAQQAEDLAQHGLSMANRRALTSYKRRFQGEIGRLQKADTALQEAIKARNAARAQGLPMLYATNNLGIDDFLDNQTPNMFSINSNDIYAKGAKKGQALSSRIFNNREESAIGGYYQNLKSMRGMSPAMLNEFMNSRQFNALVDQAMIEQGIAGNLTGADYQRARQNFISGFYDGIVYEEKDNLQRNPGVLTPTERYQMWLGARQDARAEQELADKRAERDMAYYMQGITRDAKGNPVYNFDHDIETQRKMAVAGAVASAKKGASGSGSSSDYRTQGKNRVKIRWKSGDPNTDSKYREYSNLEVVNMEDSDEHVGSPINFRDLPEWAKEIARMRIGNGRADMYDYYFNNYYDRWGPWNRHAELEMEPKDIKKYGDSDESSLQNIDFFE